MNRTNAAPEQVVLRLPPSMAERMRKTIAEKKTVNMSYQRKRNSARGYTFTEGDKVYDAELVDLPCIVETHKTLDNSTFFKSGEVGQMLVVKPEPGSEEAKAAEAAAEEAVKAATRKDGPPKVVGNIPVEEIDDSVVALSGLTPPTAHIRKRRWNKTTRGPYDKVELAEVVDQLKQLLDKTNDAEIRTEYEGVIDMEPFMIDWPEKLTIALLDGRVESTNLDNKKPFNQAAKDRAAKRRAAKTAAKEAKEAEVAAAKAAAKKDGSDSNSDDLGDLLMASAAAAGAGETKETAEAEPDSGDEASSSSEGSEEEIVEEGHFEEFGADAFDDGGQGDNLLGGADSDDDDAGGLDVLAANQTNAEAQRLQAELARLDEDVADLEAKVERAANPVRKRQWAKQLAEVQEQRAKVASAVAAL